VVRILDTGAGSAAAKERAARVLCKLGSSTAPSPSRPRWRWERAAAAAEEGAGGGATERAAAEGAGGRASGRRGRLKGGGNGSHLAVWNGVMTCTAMWPHDTTSQNSPRKPLATVLRVVFRTVLIVRGPWLPGFVVRGSISDDPTSSRSKNRLFPCKIAQLLVLLSCKKLPETGKQSKFS